MASLAKVVYDLMLDSKNLAPFEKFKKGYTHEYVRYKRCCLICECVINENWNYMDGLCQICSPGWFVEKKRRSDLCALSS